MSTLGIFLKHPVPGTVKTRLGAEIGNDQSAALYRAFLEDILERTSGIATQRVLAYAPETEEARSYFQALTKSGDLVWPQPHTGLGERMFALIQDHIADGPVVIIGSDSPSIPVAEIQKAFNHLTETDIVLGPAIDGGYFLVGQRQVCEEMFDQVDWSTPLVLSQTIQNIRKANRSLQLLNVWYDIDTLADLRFLFAHLQGLELAGKGNEIPVQTYAMLKELLADNLF